MESRIRLGLVGLGHVAVHQISAIDVVDDMTLSAACDLDTSRRSVLPKDLPFFGSLDLFLASGLFDAVLVSVPASSHEMVATSALRAGYDVVLEKPMTPDMAAFDRLSHLAIESGQILISALHAAYGREIEWFVSHRNRPDLRDLGPITGFSCRFHDPYFDFDGLLPAARSLEGAWFDSAINALSAICRLLPPQSLRLDYAALTRVPNTAPREVQGSAELTFIHDDVIGRGAIDTNWTLGLNSKLTRLFFADGHEVLLQHSTESVHHIDPDGRSMTLISLADYMHRLTAHYVGVYTELREMLQSRNDNLFHARALHALVFAAYDAKQTAQFAADGAKL